MLARILLAAAFLSAPGLALGEPAATPSAAEPAQRITPQVTHVGLVVRDAKLAASQTLASLKLPASALVADMPFAVHGGRYKGRFVDFTVHITIVETGNVQLEYIQPLTGTSPYRDALRGGQDGVTHHIAFTVPSIDDRLTEARKVNPNVEVVLDAPIAQVGRYVYARGILPGTLVEFIEMGQGHRH